MSKQISQSCCGNPLHQNAYTRRDFLYVGLIGGIGLTLGDYLKMQGTAIAGPTTMPTTAPAIAAAKGPAAKSVIHIFLPGGMSGQDSFDPKPLTPIEYRGPFGVIKTKLDGVQFGEMLPNIAGIADKITVCRSMTHGEAAHERGTHNMFTGYRPSPAIMYPSIGSVVSHELGVRNSLPPYVCVPSLPNPYAGSGYLNSAYGPFSLGADPSDGNFRVRDLSLHEGIDEDRFHRRQSMLAAVDSHFKSLEQSDALEAMDAFYQQAYGVISSKEAREAFNIKAEPDALKDEYGRNAAGMRMLMCRRLVEGGVRFVSMTYGGWDHHSKIQDGYKQNMPAFDKSFAALIRDLERRGILDSTLVMVTTEFGRTPKMNKDQGRDHWPKVFSVVLAGGGVKKGMVYGTSDATGGEPDEDPLTVEDLAATVYHQLGIDPDKRLISPGDRPVAIVKGGKPVEAILT